MKNGVRQGSTSSGISFDFCLKEDISDVSKLQAWCTLNCNKVNILGSAEDLVLVAPTTPALHLLLQALTSKLSTLSLQVNVPKTCNIALKTHWLKRGQQA